MLLESAKLMIAFNMAKCVVGYFLLFLELGGMGGGKMSEKVVGKAVESRQGGCNACNYFFLFNFVRSYASVCDG